MSSILVTSAPEKGAYIITAVLTDQDGTALTPNSGLTWKLTDKAGNVVNSRSAVALTSASTVYIVLHGDDLALSSVYFGRERVVTISGTYNTTVGGAAQNNLELKLEVTFEIDDLNAVS